MTPRSLTEDLQPTKVQTIVKLKSTYKFNTSHTISPIIVGMIHCNIKVCAICIRIVRQSIQKMMLLVWYGLHAINLLPQNRTLRDSKAQLLINEYRFNKYTLYPSCVVKPEPIWYITSYTVNIKLVTARYCDTLCQTHRDPTSLKWTRIECIIFYLVIRIIFFLLNCFFSGIRIY